jgi:hypothetical protein
MTEPSAEYINPEFKTWPFESFGQLLKVSASLGPEVFPYRVAVSKDSNFFKAAYNGVYKGEACTVFGSEKGKHPYLNGRIVEHFAVLAADDLGEIMTSKEVFEGNTNEALTDYSQRKLNEHNIAFKNIPLPAGWRRFGYIHSHPVKDVLYNISPAINDGPTVDRLAVSFSGGDFLSLIHDVRHKNSLNAVLGLITQTQLAFMVATKKTVEVLKNLDSRSEKILEAKLRGPAPYKNFEKLGLALYAGNHIGLGKKFTLQRLIY